jgi:phosphoglycolate phosphatase
LAVVTNKEGRYTQVVLDAHQLAPTFDRVISGDSFATKKPTPVGVEACLAQFGVSKDRALFVGDSSIDAATARNAGVPVWLLPYGYNMGEPIESCQPDRVIADFSALVAADVGAQFAASVARQAAVA